MSAHRHRFWLEAPHGFIAATWFWPSATPPTRAKAAVVIVPGFAVEERTMATGLAALAETCADRGIPTIIFDLEGVAQSSDSLAAPDIVGRWPEDVRTVIEHVRSAGIEHVVVVGARTGALIAACADVEKTIPDEPIVVGAVLWGPVTSGRRLSRELALLQGVSNSMTSAVDDGEPAELEIAGFGIPQSVLTGLRRFDMLKRAAPAPRVLLLDSPEREHDDIAARWRESGARVEQDIAPGTDAWLFRSMDGSDVPEADIRRVVHWIAEVIAPIAETPVELPIDTMSTARTLCHRGRRITETVVGIGADQLLGVWCEPDPADALVGAPVRLLAAPVGPGRSFVEFARDEAAAGRTSLRFEFSGSGTSPRRPGEIWNSHYSHAGSSDTAAAIDHAVARRGGQVILIGFCSSAWSALQAGPRPEVTAVAALNVHLYVSDGANSALNVVPKSRLLRALDRRLALNRRAKLFHRLYRTLPLPGVPMRWTEALLAGGVTVLLHFDANDAGLLYLRKRMPAHWNEAIERGALQVDTYARLGHSLEGRDDRVRMMAELGVQLAALDVSSSDVPAAPAASPPRRR